MGAEFTERSDGVVRLRRPRLVDAEAFVEAVERSRELLGAWVTPPPDRASFEAFVQRMGGSYVPSVLELEADRRLVGAFNLSEIVRGNFQSAYLGYYAFEPLAGHGLMRRGLALLLAFAFEDILLHRVEANVQPANTRSSALVARAGFEREGFSKGYLFIDGAWRDHERWAMRRESWLASISSDQSLT